eukprot:IDg22042t1
MNAGHCAMDLKNAISRIALDSLSDKTPNYIFSDSALVNKAAVRMFMNDSGDEFGFPCAVHFSQLAMREAVQQYLLSPIESDEESDPEDDDSERSMDLTALQRVQHGNHFDVSF